MGLYPEHYEQLTSTLEPRVNSTCAQVLKWTNFTQRNGSFLEPFKSLITQITHNNSAHISPPTAQI